jgi:hypothetical protein
MLQELKQAADTLKAGDDYKGEADEGPDGKRPKQHSIPEPTAFQRQIYEKASEFISKILVDPDDKEAIKNLDGLNAAIKEQKRKDGKDEQGGIIKYEQHILNRKLLEPYHGLETAEAANSAWKLVRIVDLLNQTYHYPRTWNVENLEAAPEDLPEDAKAAIILLNPGSGPGSGPAGSGPGSGPTNPNPTDPPPPREYKTDKGFAVYGIRNASGNRKGSGKAGGRGYLFVVGNGKPWDTDNGLDLKSDGDLGYGWVDRLVKDLEDNGKWDELNIANSKKKVTREDAPFFKEIKAIASNPIRTKTIGSKDRYPQSYSYTKFEATKANGEIEKTWHHILDRTALGTLLGKGAADEKIAEFYATRKITPPWEVGPVALTSGKPRAIDMVTHKLANTSLAAANPVTATAAATATAAPITAAQIAPGASAPAATPPTVPVISTTGVPPAVSQASQPVVPASVAPQPPASEQLLLTNKVEGLAEQMAEMMRLMAQLLPHVPPPQLQPATAPEAVMAG